MVVIISKISVPTVNSVPGRLLLSRDINKYCEFIWRNASKVPWWLYPSPFSLSLQMTTSPARGLPVHCIGQHTGLGYVWRVRKRHSDTLDTNLRSLSLISPLVVKVSVPELSI